MLTVSGVQTCALPIFGQFTVDDDEGCFRPVVLGPDADADARQARALLGMDGGHSGRCLSHDCQEHQSDSKEGKRSDYRQVTSLSTVSTHSNILMRDSASN